MSLPGLDLRHWAQSLNEDERKRKLHGYNATDDLNAAARVPIGTVAAYYLDYVNKQRIQRYFRWSV